ncbi:hypothetical protein PAMP_018042 [Pampus punctatissimus]
MLLKIHLYLRWAVHVSRMEDHFLPKITLYDKLSTGHHNVGAPKKWYKDCLKKALTSSNIDPQQWSTLAADRDVWRHKTHQDASSFEANRQVTLIEKRRRRKERQAAVADPDPNLHLQPLQLCLPFQNRTCQPQARL